MGEGSEELEVQAARNATVMPPSAGTTTKGLPNSKCRQRRLFLEVWEANGCKGRV